MRSSKFSCVGTQNKAAISYHKIFMDPTQPFQ